jgi:hypothetical protein
MWPEIAAAPVSVRLVVAGAFLPVAASAAVSVWPGAVGLYTTVTLHDFPGPRLVAVQASAVFVNAADPVSATVSEAVAVPPEFVSVKVCEAVWQTFP